MEQKQLLTVTNLTLRIRHTSQIVVNMVSFGVRPGEIVGLVGESGSGKTLAARAVIGLAPTAVERVSGTIRFEREDITAASEQRLRALRGACVGLVLQEPMTSLNPSMLIGKQLEEGLALHHNLPSAERKRLILDLLKRVGITDPEGALTSYPHQFSGGMRQRIVLASVMLLKPALLIADEPTTALDAVVQRDVLKLMVDLTRENDTAVLMISHDLGMIARYSDRVIVMRKGEVVERKITKDLLARPEHPYTQSLFAAIPHRGPVRSFLERATPILSVRDLVVDYARLQGFFRKESSKKALKGVSLDVAPNQIVAVVGGSGSGKTTLGYAIAGLIKATSGEIRYEDRSIDKNAKAYWDYRLNCQMVFQDPYSSLDPRMTIAQLLSEPLRLVKSMSRAQRRERVSEVLEEVGLGQEFTTRYGHELSGGQRQRVAIARAVVRRPKFLIADEPVSSLDVTVRARVLELLGELQRRHCFSCLFISHDLRVVEQVADRVIVMNEGLIVEEGFRDAVFDLPQHPYTRKLLSAVDTLERAPDGGVRLAGRFDQTVATGA
ncbi:dipeptide ABC transporter ATP-binding protein [Phyllobacterium endophyticum]|uniref:dipeptide ABC transporter ATP-binding protein n=1 Tax=Phyllobacterium endophyticum TaxID=1149773 RepID=UPI0011C74DC3|nr:ABC transporter ATP-binding protein [Phyllobacterium endophyticum]TXR47093.1 ABC transporter ATP-binding protein [Phyllobacterium endophyticum]